MPGESLQQLAARKGLDPSGWRALATPGTEPTALAAGQQVALPASLAAAVTTPGGSPPALVNAATLPAGPGSVLPPGHRAAGHAGHRGDSWPGRDAARRRSGGDCRYASGGAARRRHRRIAGFRPQPAVAGDRLPPVRRRHPAAAAIRQRRRASDHQRTGDTGLASAAAARAQPGDQRRQPTSAGPDRLRPSPVLEELSHAGEHW